MTDQARTTPPDREAGHPRRSGSTATPAPHADRAERDELDELVTALLTASRALVGVAARSLALVGDRVTVAQFRTLVVLDVHGASPLTTLAARLGVNASTALRQVDRLVAAGLVDRRTNPRDRRQVRISVTGAGRRLVAEVTESRRHRVAEVVRAMPVGARAELVDALAAFAVAADEPPLDDAAPLGWWTTGEVRAGP